MENKKKRNRTKQTTDNKKVTKQKLTFPPLHQGCDIPSAEEKENKINKPNNRNQRAIGAHNIELTINT